MKKMKLLFLMAALVAPTLVLNAGDVGKACRSQCTFLSGADYCVWMPEFDQSNGCKLRDIVGTTLCLGAVCTDFEM